ncbi:GNAT family N-acetyltransferase [Actibacterium ureilyticum]|uniref:GNAT family N-acetyltransferase n=1 Tax=Actibacterium ureilyticum TaxID=1590614 RepID=UPI000BAAC960|nr:GNAT family N-acetyltransferase [Actibacterium ureilyticum]
MTPEALADLHVLCFTSPRPWTATEFRDLLRAPGTFLATVADGFVLGRVIADEAELLTIAVHPDARRAGHGARLLRAFIDGARARGATRAFLEVAADNAAARGLYAAQGFTECGQRPGYYRGPDGRATDALVLERALTDPASWQNPGT